MPACAWRTSSALGDRPAVLRAHRDWRLVAMPVLELCDSERGGWINYEVHGSHGAPEHVVCVNGFMTALDSWHGVVADFGDELDKYQVRYTPRV